MRGKIHKLLGQIKKSSSFHGMADRRLLCDRGERVTVMIRVVVDTVHGQVVDSRQIYVKPEWSSSLTPFCTQLTGITNEMVANVGNLREAIQQVGFRNNYNMSFVLHTTSSTLMFTQASFLQTNRSVCLLTDLGTSNIV